LKTIYFRFKNIFALQMIYKWKRFRIKKNFTFISKTLLLCKWFINENLFILKSDAICFHFENVFEMKTFSPRLQASMISSTHWLHHNHHSPCAQSIRFSWPKRYHSLTLRHKLYVLCHKFLKDISPRIGYDNNERLTTSLHVLAMRSRAACWSQTST